MIHLGDFKASYPLIVDNSIILMILSSTKVVTDRKKKLYCELPK